MKKRKRRKVTRVRLNSLEHVHVVDYEWSIVLNRICLKCIGIWPENESTSILDAYVAFILTFYIFACIIPCLHSLVRIWGDITLMVNNLQYTLPILIALLKAFIMWRKKKKLVLIMDMFKADWLKFKTEKEKNVMIRRAHIARVLSLCGYIIGFLLTISVMTLPLFGIMIRYVTNATDSDRPLPLPSYYVYDTSRSPYYEITLALQSVCGFLMIIMYCGTDTFIGLLVFHMCGQLENLRARILCLDVNEFDNTMSYNVRDYGRLIRSVEIIDDTFTMMLLGLLIYFGLLFILYGFLMTAMVTDGYTVSLSRLLFSMSTFIGAFTHMCFYCILGEILVIQCDGVYGAVCEYEWYKLKPRQARNLLPIMIRSSKPLCLTAGKFFPMTMSTFCSLLKTSAGYMSVLLAYRK